MIDIKKLLLFIILIWLESNYSLGQNKFTVNYFYTDTIHGKGFYFKILEPFNGYPFKTIQEYKLISVTSDVNKNLYHTQCNYLVKDTSTCIIGDGYGHNSFVIPNDTISIYFKKMNKTNGTFMLDGKYQCTWFNNFSYEGKNKYVYSLFDSLAYHTGLPDLNTINLAGVDYSLKRYFDTITNIYLQRIKYTQAYCIRYNLPTNIKRLAFSEIKSSYISNLLEPIVNRDKEYTYSNYPNAYIDTLNGAKFSDEYLFTRTLSYSLIAYKYVYLFQNKLLINDKNENVRFKNIYNTINNQYPNKKIKQFLLLSHLISNITKRYSSYDTLANNYRQQFPNSKYTIYFDSLYTLQKEKWKITLEQALTSQVSDVNGQITLIKNIIGSKPAIIDCWASWCMPCLEQMPFSKEMEKRYSDKVIFIYLSFDKSKNAWIAKNQALGLNETSYLLSGNFKSDFANHFDINSIPRYLIFNKDGKLVTPHSPTPSKTESFEKILDALIKNN